MMNEASSVAGHEARNRELVARLLAMGESLTDVRACDLFFYAPTRDMASALAQDLQQLGVVTLTVMQSESGPRAWSVQGVLETSVQHVASAPFTVELLHVATRHGSEYDGWGTQL
jgi:hypothetical protein